MAWYREWFRGDYLELYAHRDAGEAERHLDFFEQRVGERSRSTESEGTAGESVATEVGGLVLDLACGGGRHTAALRRRGYRSLGVDLSVTLLATEPRVAAAAGDMRQLPYADESFQWVLNFFTSFGYFERERENFQVLEEIARVLQPGGRFLIDFLNRERVLAELRSHDVQKIDQRTVHIERWYDTERRRINKRMKIEGSDGSASTYLESVRAYEKDEVTIGCRWAGLEVESWFGNFDGDPYQHDSERLILVGYKAS